ncbi:hypothetical protein [Cellulosimicrobium funkei]|uniref:hypothetical protein n=1 Tax=Cellulosimicrobium funkei TaxID=264251 RepID=UPI003F4DDBA7
MRSEASGLLQRSGEKTGCQTSLFRRTWREDPEPVAVRITHVDPADTALLVLGDAHGSELFCPVGGLPPVVAFLTADVERDGGCAPCDVVGSFEDPGDRADDVVEVEHHQVVRCAVGDRQD